MSRRLPRFVVLQRVATGAVVLLGFAALALGGELPAPTAAVVAAALLWRALRAPAILSPRAWIAVQLGFLAWLGASWGLVGEHVLTVFAQLLMFVQLHRVLTRRGARDDIYSFFIAFGMVLLGSVLTFSPLWFLLFLAFLQCFVLATLLARLALSVEADWDQWGPGGPVPHARWRALDPLVRAPVLLGVAALNALLLAGTVGLFFVLPRMEVSFLSGSLLPPVHISGFSDRVRLGELGLLQLSDAPVMRVRAFDASGSPASAASLYWHGLALDRFDGRDWTLSDPRKQGLVSVQRGSGPPARTPWSLRLEVGMEPLDSRVLFFVPRAAGIYGDFTTLDAASTEGFFLSTPRRRESYVVYSDPQLPDPERLRRLDPRRADPALLARYTQLPVDLSPRVAALAEQWTAGAPSALDEALLVRGRLRTDFTYSLDQPASAFPDPLLAFLEEVQEGHCEYFATAMAVMLRARGLPARVVNGFSGGEWNSVGEYWLVRQHDAHSWVELWFPEAGWVLFDPTPAAADGLAATARQNLRARLRAWADYGQLMWSDVMLDYDLGNQAAGFRAILRGLGAFGGDGPTLPSVRDEGERAGEGTRFPPAWLAVLLLAAAGVAVTARGRAVRLRSREARAVERLHRRLRSAARDVAAAPLDHAPPLAFARWAAERDPERFGDAPAAIELWYAARYGGGALPGDLGARCRRLARAARRWRPTISGRPPSRADRR